MGNKVYVEAGRNLIRLSEANNWQRNNCDRVILNKHQEVIKTISAEELSMIDLSLDLDDIPKEITMGTVVKIKQRNRFQDLMKQI